MACAMMAGVQSAFADDFNFVGIYTFSSTATVVDEISGWATAMPSEFDFNIVLNNGDDASTYPYLVKGFLPRNIDQKEPNALKAKAGTDGESLVIEAGEAGVIYGDVPHLCAYSGAGFEGGVGQLTMTMTGANTFTFAEGISATWHQFIDLGFGNPIEEARDIVKFSAITVTKAVEEATDFVGAWRLTCTNVPLSDKLIQTSWPLTDYVFEVLPNEGQFDEQFDYVVHNFMRYSYVYGEGVDSWDGAHDFPAYRASDGKSLVIVAGEDYILHDGGTHFCVWSGHDGKDGGTELLVMSPKEDGDYTFADGFTWLYHNFFQIGPMVFDEPNKISYFTDINVTRTTSGIHEVALDNADSTSTRVAGTYSLDGRRVSSAARPGFYIVGGKKVIR